VSEELTSFLQQCVRKPLSNQQRKKSLEKYPLPDTEELRPPKLDMTLKLLISKATGSHDGWLQKIQALCLDAYAPIIAILEEQEHNEVTTEELQSALQCSLQLMGNTVACLTKERRRKVLCAVHKDLGHMAEEEFESSTSFFGEEVVDGVRKRHDVLKTLRQAKQPFWRGGAQRQNLSGHHDNQGSYQYQGSFQNHTKFKGPVRKPRTFNQSRGQAPYPKKT